MGKKVIVNADDFGLSRGVNAAIEQMFKEGNLTSASLMAAAKYAPEAAEIAAKNKSLKVGLHFNLTTGKAAAEAYSIPLLINANGIFKNGFLKLLLLAVFCPKALGKQVEIELEAQILLAKKLGVKLSHIDGHRHVHFIPIIFKKVCASAKKHKIKRVRVINESLFCTLRLGVLPPLSGLIKWGVLKTLGLFNGSARVKAPYFFSIIHSCRITNKIGQKFKLKKGFDEVEFMLHPGLAQLDGEAEYEASHLHSKYRKEELKFKKPKL